MKTSVFIPPFFFYIPDSDCNFILRFLYCFYNLEGGIILKFTSFLQDGQLTVALTGEIDHHCAKAYIQAITAKIEAYMPHTCILDFQDVTFIDSSGIAVVINAMRSITQIEGTLILSGIADQPMKVFRASGIDKLVQIKEAVS